MDLLSASQLIRKGEYQLTYKFRPFEIDDDDPVDFVAVTRRNSIVELQSDQKSAECFFDFTVGNKCSNLSVFQSYNPTYRHYLFMNDDYLVVVVKREDRLSVRDTIRGAVKYSIVDRYGLGKPQVEVETMNGVIEVFDFSEKLFASRHAENRLEGGVKLKVQSQIQMLTTRVKSAEELLLEKTRLINKYTKSVLMNANNIIDDDDDAICRVIPVIGSPIGTQSLSNGSVLEVGPSWVKILENQWVIGFLVTNSLEIPLSQFQLFAFCKNVPVKETFMFCNSSPGNMSKVEFFSPSDRLNGFQSGFIVGVLNEPHFIQPAVKFECMVICRSTTEHQTCLGQIVVNGDNSRKLSLFEPDLSFTDLIAIQATYKQLNLGFESDNPSESQCFLFQSLIDAHNFLPVNESAIVNISKESSYYSILVVKNRTHPPNNYRFVYKELNQVLLLLHDLRKTGRYRRLAPKSEIGSWISAKNALKEELTYIQIVLINELTEGSSDENEVEYSVNHLLNLQMRTAKEIASVR